MVLYSLLHLSGHDLPLDELKRFRRLHTKTPGHPEVGLTPGVETTTGPLGQGLANNKLVALYDDNGISIDGAVQGWFVDDTPARFRAYGWNDIGPIDGHSVVDIEAAIAQAKACSDRPTLIDCRTTIGKGSPAREGSAKAHGEPLGADEVRHTREAIGWPHAPFEIPADLAVRLDARAAGSWRQAQWQARVDAYRGAHPALAAEFERRLARTMQGNFEAQAQDLMATFAQSRDSVATRKSSQQVLAALAPKLPELLGGSADLTGSNLTDFPGCGAVRGGQSGGRHINDGVREFGMAALMKLRVIHVFTHDSIGLGEDGLTHQPVEHAASLRLIPNLDLWRPCDGTETAVAWAHALCQRERPSTLLLSRQNLPAQVRTPEQVQGIGRGGYVLSERADAVAVILATGSEVSLAIAAQQLLDTRGVAVRVVSLPSSTLFDRQARGYRDEVLGCGLPRVEVEASVTRWWGQYGCCAALGIDQFGESAPAAQLDEHFGLTAAKLADLVQAQCDEQSRLVRSGN